MPRLNQLTLAPDATLVILTGAGISRESGLETFRDKGGVWDQVNLEEVATPEAFAADPKKVHAFYNARRAQLVQECPQPNAAHHALARLEKKWAGDVIIITQNIDDLHNQAGNQALYPMHGELLKVRCTHCGTLHPWRDNLDTKSQCPSCDSQGSLRPHVVWFGEVPLYMEEIAAFLEDADLFVAIGTSGTVYPAAGFVQAVRQKADCHTLELNLEPSDSASLFEEKRYGRASDLVPAFVDELLNG